MNQRLSYVLGSLSRRGAGLTTACQSYARHLAKRGYELDVYGQWDEDFNRDQILWEGARLHALPTLGPGSLHVMPGMKTQLLNRAADLLHLHGLWTHWTIDGFRWHQHTWRPYVISAHGMLESWALAKSGWKKKLALAIYERRHLNHAAALHAVGQQEVEDYQRLGLLAPIHLIPNGVEIAERPNFEKREKTLLFMARIQEKKGILPLLKGWAQSHASTQGWRLQIAGWDEGGCEDRSRQLAQTLGITETVDWLGPLIGEAKWEKLRATGAFILPSYSEGLPMAVLEAWAHGVPTLISGACNLPDALGQGAAIQADPDQHSIAAALNTLTALNFEQQMTLARRGYDHARRLYSAETAAQRLDELYRSLLYKPRANP